MALWRGMKIMNRLCSGLLRPVHDESFSSWISRIRYKHNISPINIGAFDQKYDFDICAAEHVDENFINKLWAKRFFEMDDWRTLDIRRRIYFCEYCIFNDVSEGRAPSWRKSWLYDWCAVCDKHKIPLMEISNPTQFGNPPAWAAYKQFTKQAFDASHTFGGLSFCVYRGDRRSHLSYMASATQKWIRRAIARGEFTILGRKIKTSTNEFKVFCGDILDFLMRGHVHCLEQPCIAASVLRGARDYPGTIYDEGDEEYYLSYGRKHASFKARLAALVFLGNICGAYSESLWEHMRKQQYWGFGEPFNFRYSRKAIIGGMLSSERKNYRDLFFHKIEQWPVEIRDPFMEGLRRN